MANFDKWFDGTGVKPASAPQDPRLRYRYNSWFKDFDEEPAGVKKDEKDSSDFWDTVGDWSKSATEFIERRSPSAQLRSLLSSAGIYAAEDLGVDVSEDTKNRLINKQTAEDLAQMLTGFEQPLALTLKGVGEMAKGAADNIDARNNPNGDNPYTNGKATRALGDLLMSGGEYFAERAESPERQQAFHQKQKDYGTPADMIANGTLGEYLTDPGGFGQDLTSGVGNAAYFMTLAKMFPTITAGGRLPQGVSAALGNKITGTTSGLLNRAGLNKAAQVIGSNGARDLLSSGIEFAPTMGLGQAITNAGTIVDALRQQGLSDAEIYERIKGLIADELPADMAFAGITGPIVKGLVGKALAGRNASIPKLAAAQLPGVGLESAGGFYSNLYQMMLSEKYSGKPYGEMFGEHTQEEADAANLGLLLGAIFSAGGMPNAIQGAREADARYNRATEQTNLEKPLYGKFREDTQEYLDKYGEAGRQSYRDAVNEGNLRELARREAVPDNVFDTIMRVADEEGVPRERLLAQAIAESNGNQDEISPVGAIGVMQLIPETAEALGVDPDDLEQNIRGGARYLKQQYSEFGDWSLAHAAYNAGPNVVKRYGGVPPFAETQKYVDRINGLVGDIPSSEGNEQRGDGYYGEGGAGEGNTWFRQGNASLEGAQPNLLNAIDMLADWLYKKTGRRLVVTSGTDGHSHADGDHSHYSGWKVDVVDEYADGEDSDLITADFQKGNLADEFIAYGRSLGLGMNFEAAGTDNVHFDVALDGTQWDGNGDNAGGFNPRNGRNIQTRADEIYANKKRGLDANKPSWSDYVKAASKTNESTQEPEPEKPRQISLDDAIFSDFANDRLTKAVEDKDVDTIQFFSGMFEDDGTFADTRKNRAMIQRRYGDELAQFAETHTSPATAAQEQPAQTQQSKPQPKQTQQPATPAANNKANKFLRNDPVIQAGHKFIEELGKSGKAEDFGKSLGVYAAIQQGDANAIRNILKENGREELIQQAQQESQPQAQEDPVKQNATPENKLAQPPPAQETPQPQEQDQTQVTQETQQQPSLIEQARALVKEATEEARQTWENVKQGYKNRGTAAKAERDIANEVTDDMDDTLFRDDEAEERQSTQERQEEEHQTIQKQQQERADAQNKANFEKERPALQQAMYWLYDNGNEQAARELDDAISEGSLYKAHVIIERNKVPASVMDLSSKRETQETQKQQETESDFDSLVTRARQTQNILMNDGDIKGAQEIDDAIQSRDVEKLRNLPTTLEGWQRQKQQEAQAREETEAKSQRESERLANALAEPSTNKHARKQQGGYIVRMVDSPEFQEQYGTIELSDNLRRMAQDGQAKAINEVQRRIRELTSTSETGESKTNKTPQKKRSILPRTPEERAALVRQGRDLIERLESPEIKYANANLGNINALKRALATGNEKAINIAQGLLNEIESTRQSEENNRRAQRERDERLEREVDRDAEVARLESRIDDAEALDDLFVDQEDPLKTQEQIEREQRERRQKNAIKQSARGQEDGNLFEDETDNTENEQPERARKEEQAAFEDELDLDSEIFDSRIDEREEIENLFEESEARNEPAREDEQDFDNEMFDSQFERAEREADEEISIGRRQERAKKKRKEKEYARLMREEREREERERRLEDEEQRDAEDALLEKKFDDAEALDELFGEEESQDKGKPKEEPKQQEKTTPQEFSEELAQIEKHAEDEGFDPRTALHAITHFASALKKHLAKPEFLGKYPKTMTDIFDQIDSKLLDAMAKNKKGTADFNNGDSKALADNVQQFRKWSEDIFDQVHRASDDEAQIKNRERELDRYAPRKRGEEISEEELFADVPDKATPKDVLSLADKLKALLDEHLHLHRNFTYGADRLFDTIDKAAKRFGDDIQRFKTFCRELIEDANNGQLTAHLREYEPQGRSRPSKSSKTKQDPQAGAKAKERAEKLKSDIAELLRKKNVNLDDYPLFKADLFETIDKAAKLAEKTGKAQPFASWCKVTLDGLQEIAREKARKGEKSPLQKWLEHKEEYFTKEKESTVKHELPTFRAPEKATLRDLRDLADQAWDDQMRAELETLYNVAKQTGFDAYYYGVAKTLFERRYEKQDRTPRTTPAPKTLRECKTVDDLGAYWRNKYNPRTSFDPKLSDLDFAAVKEFLDGVEKVVAAFPKLKDRILNVVCCAQDPNTYASATCRTFVHQLSLNLSTKWFKDRGKLLEALAEDVKSHWSPGKGTVDELGVHEAAHLVSQMLFVRAGYFYNMAPKRMSGYDDNAKKLVEWASELIPGQEGRPLKGAKLTAAREAISSYAIKKDKWGETISEAAADFATFGEKANPLSIAIAQRLNEAFEGDVWRERTVLQFVDVAPFWKGSMRTATVAKWYARRATEHFPDGEMLTRSNATSMIADEPLRDALQQVIASRDSWEALLKSKTPDEKILESGEWTDAAINELAKDSMVEFFIRQVGGTITDGKVKLEAKERGWLVEHLEEMINPAARYSREGDANLDMSNIVDPKNLTPAQKLLQSFSDALGVKTVFFDNPNGNFHGAFKDGVTFLNVNSKKGLGGVFWHESFHWLKANNPKLYAKLVEAAGITQAQRDAFLKRTGRKDLTTNEEIDEEILADQMEDVAKRTGLLQSIAGKNRGLVERVVQWLKDTMNKFIDTFRTPTGKLTTKQAQALASEFGKIAHGLKDADGNQIFRVSNRTGDIEVIGGRTPPNVLREQTQTAVQSPNIKYSIDPADNSNQSWGRRLKNWTAGLTGSKKSPDRIHQEMKQRLMDLSNMKIAAGHLPKGMQESVDEVARVIRTKKEYDWVKVLPHVGNSVAAQLGITQSVEMSNCIAKYLYDGVVDEQSAEGKEFIQAMRNNEELRDKILATQEVFGRWREMSTVEKQIASIQFGKPKENLTAWERVVKNWREMRRQLFDAQAPIGYQVEHFEKATGMKLADSMNPEVLFRNLRGTQGLALSMIDGGREEAAVLTEKFANINFDNWKSVAEILHMAGAFKSDQNYKEFADFVTANQILTLHKHNDNNRKKQAEIRQKISELKADLNLAGTKTERDRIEKSIERKERALSDLQDSIKELPEAWDTKEKCEKAIAELSAKHGDKFEKAQKALVEYSNTLMAMRVDAGLMSTRRFNELLNVFPDYVPLHRIFDENSDLEGDSDKHMVGSGKDIIDPIQAIMDNTFDIVHRCEKNKAKQMLATLARFDGVGRIFEEVEPGSNDGTIINFYEGGKRKCLQCADPALVKAVNNLAPAPMNWAMKLFRVPTLVLKGATTALSPAFMARNLFRDPQDAYVYSAKGGGNVFKDALRYMTPLFALKCTFDTLCGNNKTYEALINKLNMEVDKKLLAQYRIYGGSQSTFFDFDANVKADLFAKYAKGNWKRFASPKGVLRFLEKLGELSERGTRLQRFKQVKDNLKEQHGGINIYDDLVTAAFESRDLMDFARHGEAGHTWNTMAAFANPALQGIDKLIRTFDVNKLKKFGGTEETQKQWMSSVARLMIGSILPAIVLTVLHKDDDWYKDDLQPWEKDAYWIISEDFKIPKGADVATRFFSNLAEALVNSDNEPIKAKRILMPLYDGLPNLLPTAMAPVIECFFNKDMFKGTPIIPMRERYLSATPEKQYDSSNSNFAIWLGNKLGVSPRQIDHMIYGYTGNLGKGAMKVVDTGLHATGLSDKPVQPWTQAWIPVVGGFLREPYANSKIVRDYYAELDKQRSYVEAYKLDRKTDKNAKLDEDFDRKWYARLKAGEKAMGEFAKRERAILDNPKLTSEQVEEQRRKIQEKRIALLRRIFEYKRAQ